MTRVEEQSVQSMVFFDFMGIYMIVYRVSLATTLNAMLIIIALVDMILRKKDSGLYFHLSFYLRQILTFSLHNLYNLINYVI